jgi:putative Holliday junction resolvase
MKIIAFDVGERRTGVAFFDSAIDFVIPLDTIQHANADALLEAADAVLRERGVAKVVVGLPLLPSGLVGSQARFARQVQAELAKRGYDVDEIDERFTTDRVYPGDGDAKAACIILNTYLQRKNEQSA